uniref:Thioredoxin n=1 Tax=Chelydra serpentina TaxID=8475 RepID=A0A8C3S282_CHESE
LLRRIPPPQPPDSSAESRRPAREGVSARAELRGWGWITASTSSATSAVGPPPLLGKGWGWRGANRACALRPEGWPLYKQEGGGAAPQALAVQASVRQCLVSATRAATMVKTVGNLSLCEKFPDVVFLEVDVDDAQDVASECAVQCMPTFHFYKQGKKVHEFSGANREKLEESITKLR